MAFVQLAFMMSLLLMFVLLVTQFNSIYQSLLILLAVVMSTAGVLLGLLILQAAFQRHAIRHRHHRPGRHRG